MRLDQNELLFLNGVTRRPEPFGIFLTYPADAEMEGYKEKVTKSLQEKGVLDGEQKFTKEGTALLLLWERYCDCGKHLVLNHMFLAAYPDRRAIGVGRHGEEYELFSADSAVVMAALLKKFDFLRMGDTEGGYRLEKIPYDEWTREIEGYGENLLILGDYRKKAPEQEEVYYWKGDKGYRYDLGKGHRRQISSRSMRLQLLKYLGIKGGQQDG